MAFANTYGCRPRPTERERERERENGESSRLGAASAQRVFFLLHAFPEINDSKARPNICTYRTITYRVTPEK